MWRSLVARLLWEQDVAGSNPAIPIRPCDVMETVTRSDRVYAGSSPARGTDCCCYFRGIHDIKFKSEYDTMEE